MPGWLTTVLILMAIIFVIITLRMIKDYHTGNSYFSKHPLGDEYQPPAFDFDGSCNELDNN